MQARSETVGEYETVGSTCAVLAHDAAMGLGADYEARASALGDGADREQLGRLAASFFGRSGLTVVIVGPRAKLEGPLRKAGFGSIEYRDAEGIPVLAKRTQPR